MSTPSIELLTLGDELLFGIRENSHLKYIGSELQRHGLSLQRNIVVQDNADEIKSAFRNAWDRSDIVITTGGLGSARVNNTREAIAEILNIGLEFVPAIQEAIENDFNAINRKMGKRFIRQCYKLEGSETLPNNFGTAPGLFLQHHNKTLIMLPGMASELRPMFQNEVLPRLQDNNILKDHQAYTQIRTIGIDEDQLEQSLNPILEKYPGITSQYCLFQGIIDVRIASDALQYSWDQLSNIAKECRSTLGLNCFAIGHQSLPEIVSEHLRTIEKTIAIAESCTGGKVSDALTNIPGASKIFNGGLVCYNNEAKIHMLGIPHDIIHQHGAVSPETAVAMASAVSEKFSSHYGLSITGFAGPTGGSENDDPVGTIYIGYSSPSGAWAHKVHYPGQREAIKVRAVNAAFDWMRRKLNQDKIEDFMADIDLES